MGQSYQMRFLLMRNDLKYSESGLKIKIKQHLTSFLPKNVENRLNRVFRQFPTGFG